MSTELLSGEIFTLIPRVMAAIGGVAKTRKNEQQKYTFRGIEDFYLAAHPALIEHGVFCAPNVLERTEYRFDKTNEYGKTTTWVHVALKVEHRFFAPDGSFVPVTTWGEGLDNSDKASNKAMSGAMKYALIELFCVPTQDVEDSDRTSPEQGTRRNKEVARTTEDIEIKPKSAPDTGSRPLEGSQDTTKAQGADAHSTARNGFATEGQSATPVMSHARAEQAAVQPLVVEYITAGQAANIHQEFRKVVKKDNPGEYLRSDQHFYQFLAINGFINDANEPTAGRIPASRWFQVKEAALAYAKNCK